MKRTLVIYLTNNNKINYAIKQKRDIKKKLYNLVINKRINDDIWENTNQTTTNLSDIERNDDKTEVLNLGLK